MGSLPPSRCSPANPVCPGKALLCLPVAQLAPPALGRCCTPTEQLPSTAHPQKSSVAQKHWGNPCLATGSLPPSWCRPASPSCPQQFLLSFRVTLLALPTLGNAPLPQRTPSNTTSPWKAVPGQTLPNHGECTSTTKKKITSKMKKLETIPS